ncbi:MAG TPA: hypothetical protein VEI47_00740 [Gemmatimonadales bacterium]|nr:hypothetical protein [Gemmatimonadales bacterium]
MYPLASGLRRPGYMLASVIVLATACGKGGGGSQLKVSWTGSDTTSISVTPTVAWCPVANRLEVRAITDDQGFGLVLYPQGELAPGEYPIFDPATDTIRRPGGTAAARRFTQREVLGFESDSGAIELTRAAGLLQLRFGVRMIRPSSRDTIRAEGEANGLRPSACPGDSVPNGSPKQ